MKVPCMKAAETQILGCSAAVKSLLFALVIFSVLNTVKLPPSRFNDERISKWDSTIEEFRQNFNEVNSGSSNHQQVKPAEEVNAEESVIGKQTIEEIKDNRNIIESAVSGAGNSTKPFEANDKPETESFSVIPEKPTENKSLTESSTTPAISSNSGQGQDESSSSTESNRTVPSASLELGQEQEVLNSESPAAKTSIMCEFSDYRYNMCFIEANLKVIASSETVLIIPPSPATPANNTVWKIRPFTRKWEKGTMSNVKELTIRWASDQNEGPGCDVTHDVPVLIFATVFLGANIFHDFTDVLIPLFVAAKRYNGKIQFVATNFEQAAVNKYLPHLQELSQYPIINLDSETLVHCFPLGQIGLRGNGPLSVETSAVKNDYSTQEFRQLLRKSLSLKRSQVEIIEKNSNKKPKMAILIRQSTRTFTNEKEIIEMAEGVGFEVVRLDTETTKDFPRVAHLINSCDVLMGSHGAGLTNMIYLPSNATVIQIIPWGDLGFISWKDYGEPTKDMGLNYVEYEIKIEESTLIEKYPRNHTVFTNPQELHKQGWSAMYNVFMVEQNVKLDVDRFREVLVGLFNSLTK